MTTSRRTWTCTIDGTPCSALGDGYSGTYYSNDGGATWCCASTDPDHLGTLIPASPRLAGGQYDAGGDPAVAFDTPRQRLLRRPRVQSRRRRPTPSPSTRARFDAAARALVGPAGLHQPDDGAVDPQRQGVDRGRQPRVEPRSATTSTSRGRGSSSTRHNGAYDPVADLLRPLDRRRRDLQRPEVDLRQRPLRPGLAPGRRARRHALRVLGRLDPARVELNSTYVVEVDRRRSDASASRSRSRS